MSSTTPTPTPTPDMRNLLAGLPNELYQDMVDRVILPEPTRPVIDPSKDPSVAPRHGSSPFLALPCEMRRHIFSYLLPPKANIIEPCLSSTNLETNTPVPAPTTPIQPIKSKLTLRVGDALVLCKNIASEILVTLYEERTFAINVYEGILDGGVEFLNSGRQRIQYREHFTQVRFKRFEGPNDPYGFSRIKRLFIRIYPAKEGEATEQRTNRHNAMHTHFMLHALVKLFQKDASFGLNYLQIRFIEPTASGHPHPWNSGPNSPRSSSIHGLSNIEVIMRALLELRGVQTAVCQLPNDLYSPLSEFVLHFRGVVTGKLEPNAMDGHLATQIEGARDLLDNWVHSIMFPANGDTSTDLMDIAMIKDG